MSIQIAFEVPEADLERFVALAGRVKASMPADLDTLTLARLVRAKLAIAQISGRMPDFVLDRINRLEELADMIEDTEWGLDGDELARVKGALFYFSEPVDLVPDRVPVFGFLDDALMVELTLRDFEPELEAYRKFCGFRDAEQQRRAEHGHTDEVTKEDWLADQRSLLHTRMRNRRKTTANSDGGWKISLW
jgi:uncharacterized membrane protein YkvA (DUF1232 family)